MLVCPKCGYDNELGRVFCHGCGEKLDLSSIRPPGWEGDENDEGQLDENDEKKQMLVLGVDQKKRGGGIVIQITNAIILLLIVAVVAIAVGLWMKPTLDPVNSQMDKAAASTAEEKMKVLEQAAERDIAFETELTELEVNNLFWEKLVGDLSIAEGLSNLEVDLEPNAVRIVAYKNLFEKVEVVIVLKGTLELVEKRLQYNIDSITAGKLTIPAQMYDWFLQNQLPEMWPPIEDHYKSLSKLKSVEVGTDTIKLGTEGQAPQPQRPMRQMGQMRMPGGAMR